MDEKLSRLTRANYNADFGSSLVKTQTRPAVACARFRFLGSRCAVDQPRRTTGQAQVANGLLISGLGCSYPGSAAHIRARLLISGLDFGQRELPVDLHLGRTRSDSRISASAVYLVYVNNRERVGRAFRC